MRPPFEQEDEFLKAKAALRGEQENNEPTPVSDTDIPSRIGKYEILGVLGEGGMGKVYRAAHPHLDRELAIKVILPQAVSKSGGRERAIARFRNEAKSIARLQHPNIVQVYDFEENLGVYLEEQANGNQSESSPNETVDCIAMQMVEGASLKSVISHLHADTTIKNGNPTNCEQDPTRNDQFTQSILTESIANSIRQGSYSLHEQFAEHLDRTQLSDWELEVTSTIQDQLTQPKSALPTQIHLGQAIEQRNAEITRSTARFDYSLRSVAKIGIQIAEALAYAHRSGVLHRDIKPQNIVLDQLGNAWVLDFGIAEEIESEDDCQFDSVVGSLPYMAPEVFEGKGSVRSDLYALGATLHELTTGNRIVAGTTYKETTKAIRNGGQLRLLQKGNGISKDLAAIIDKCTIPSSQERYQNCDDLAQDLRRYLDGNSVEARPQGFGERIVRIASKHRMAAGLTVATICLVLLLGITSALAAARENRLRKLSESHATAAEENEQSAIRQKDAAIDNLSFAQAKQTQLAQHMAEVHLNQGNFDSAREALKRVPVRERSLDTLLLQERAISPATELFAVNFCGSQVLDGVISNDGNSILTIDGAGNLLIRDLNTLELEHLIHEGTYDENFRKHMHVLQSRMLAAGQKPAPTATDSFTAVQFGVNKKTVFAADLAGNVVRFELDSTTEKFSETARQSVAADDSLYALEQIHATGNVVAGGKKGVLYRVEFSDNNFTVIPIDQSDSPITSILAVASGIVYGTLSGTIVFVDQDGKNRTSYPINHEIFQIATRTTGDGVELFVASRQAVILKFGLEPTGFSAPIPLFDTNESNATFFCGVAVNDHRVFALDDQFHVSYGEFDRWGLVKTPYRFQCGNRSSFQSQIVEQNRGMGFEIELPFLRKGKLLTSPQFPIVISTTEDSFIRGWGISENVVKSQIRQLASRLPAESETVFEPNSNTLIWGLGKDGRLLIVDVETDRTVADHEAFEPAAKQQLGIEVMPSSTSVVTWSGAKVKFWKFNEGQIKKAHKQCWINSDTPLMNIAVHPHETQLAAVDQRGYLLVWEFPTMRLLTKQLIGTEEGLPFAGLVAYNRDGSMLAATGPKSSAPIFDTLSFRATPDHIPVVSDSASALCWSPADNLRVCKSDNYRTYYYTISDEGDIRPLSGLGHSKSFSSLLSPTNDGRRIVYVTGNKLHFLNSLFPQECMTLTLPGQQYKSLAVASKGNQLALTDSEGRILVCAPHKQDISAPAKKHNSDWNSTTVDSFECVPQGFVLQNSSFALDRAGDIHGLYVRPQLNEGFGSLFWFFQQGSEVVRERIRPDESKYNDQICYSATIDLVGPDESPAILFRRRNPIDSAFNYEQHSARLENGRWLYQRLDQRLGNWFFRPLGIFSDDGKLTRVFHYSLRGYYQVMTYRKPDGQWRSDLTGEKGDGARAESLIKHDDKYVFASSRREFTGSPPLVRLAIWQNGEFRSVYDPRILLIKNGFDKRHYGFGRAHTLDGNATDAIYKFDPEREQWDLKWTMGTATSRFGLLKYVFPDWFVNQQSELTFVTKSDDGRQVTFDRHIENDSTVQRTELRIKGTLHNYQVICEPNGDPILIGALEKNPQQVELTIFRLDESD